MPVNIDEIKEANRIEDLVAKAGYSLHGHGRYLRVTDHDSFVVDTFNQCFYWNSRSVRGDIINWVEFWKRCGFKEAVEFLARNAGMPEPQWSPGQDGAVRLAARAKEDALTVACRRWAHWLWTNGPALEYVRGRGWNDDAIKAAGLGFTGRGTAEETAELMADFAASNVDVKSPAAVAMLGFKGDVKDWARAADVQPVPEPWLERKYVPGAQAGMLVYPHVVGGRVRYVSFRSIEDKRHMNPNQVLLGPRQPYFNHEFAPKVERAVIVEGQADAVSLAQWGIAGVALAGASANAEVLKRLSGIGQIYIGLDKDAAGDSGGMEIAKALGPMVRIVRWPHKDANDTLQELVKAGMAHEDQVKRVNVLLAHAATLVEELAKRAGLLAGADRDAATKELFEMVAHMGAADRSLYRSKLAKLLGVPPREFDSMLKGTLKERKDSGGDEEEEGTKEIVGGFIDGWLIELLYNPVKKRTLFAYRDPAGVISTAEDLEIGGVTYKPKAPDDLIDQEVVVLPSALGEEISERALVAKIVDLVHRYYLIDKFYEQLIAYYVLFTWNFDSFRNVVYLRALGEYGAGKSQLMWIVGYLSRRLIKLMGASSDATLYRTMHIYKGTVFIDEADKDFSDTESPWIKIMNAGNQKGLPVVKQREAGQGRYESEAFDVFGPKLLTTRKRFDDEALESRCITIEVVKHTTPELVARGIPLHLDKQFFAEAAELRNLLLRWRMKIWQPEIEMDRSLVDQLVQARLNQVMMPIMQIVSDPEVRDEIKGLVRRYQQRMVTEKSLTLEAKVLQAIIQIQEAEPAVTTVMDGKAGEFYVDLSMGNIAKVANAIIDAENADADEEGDSADGGSGKKKLKSRGIGPIVTKRLNLASERMTGGPLKGKYVAIWDEERIRGLRGEYGV